MNASSVFPFNDAGILSHATVHIIKIGREHIPDYDPDHVDQALADLNGLMRDRETMPLAELRDRLDHPRSHRVNGLLPSDVVLIGIILSRFAIYPWADCPYGLLFEFPHGWTSWPGVENCMSETATVT